jgi:hypothetical protein
MYTPLPQVGQVPLWAAADAPVAGMGSSSTAMADSAEAESSSSSNTMPQLEH